MDRENAGRARRRRRLPVGVDAKVAKLLPLIALLLLLPRPRVPQLAAAVNREGEAAKALTPVVYRAEAVVVEQASGKISVVTRPNMRR